MANEKAAGPKIYAAINEVMKDIGAVGKTSKNQQQGFMFRGIDAVMNAISPALIKHKVFVVPEILEQTREERQTKSGSALIYSVCRIRYTFFADDGSSISAVVIGEGMDSGDKATNKAMSIAFKYACFQVFCIPTEEMVDPDEEVHEVKPKGKKADKKDEPAADPKAAKLNAEDFETLASRMADEKIPEELIAKLYKVGTIDEINYRQLENIYANWDKIIDLAATN